MPRDIFTRVVLRPHLALSCLAISAMLTVCAAAQPVVLSGLTTSFTKAVGTDPSLPANQDAITSNVALTRGSSGGVYNAADESGFPVMDPGAISPKFTQWATNINNPSQTIAATNWAALDFDTWLNAYGGLMGAGPNTVGRDAVLRIVRDEPDLEDVYLDIRFTSWVSGGGGFSYLRSKTPNGDYNADGAVDAADYVVWRKTHNQMLEPGKGADGDLSGAIDDGDYSFWTARFGNVVPGSGGSIAVPEPAPLLLLLVSCIAVGLLRPSRHLACN